MGRSQVYDRQFYVNLGKSVGLAGAELDGYTQSSQSWQAKAMRAGHLSGVALYMAHKKGYAHAEVPLHGRNKVITKFCTIEHPTSKRSCGCAFGQCAKGLVL